MDSEVISPVNISHTAPDFPSPFVSRPHLINTIRQIFESSAEMVCVEGHSGYGKTTLLREFAESSNEPCFCVFLSSSSRLTYDPAFARADLTDQVFWYLYSKRPDETAHFSDGYLRTLWTKCSHRLLRTRRTAYIIVDGLHDIPSADQSLKKALMALLPFGVKPFKFLFTGDLDADIRPYCPRLRSKSFQIPSFGSHESDEFLNSVVDDKKQRNEYHVALAGVPSLLASLRRQITALKAKELQDLPTFSHDIESLFRAEWSLQGEISLAAQQVLAVILAHGYPLDTDALCRECDLEPALLESELRALPFVRYSENPRGWTFVSDAFRSFAEHMLPDLVKDATERLTTRLLSDPDSQMSLRRLPVYLERIGKTEKLLEWFNERRLAAMLKMSGSPASVEPTLREALAISFDAKSDIGLTTYSLLSSSILQLANTTGIDDEIRARCALADYDGALAIANKVPLLTQRVRLLSVMADSLSQTPGYPVQRLVTDIESLMSNIDVSQLPKEEALDLAIDLYPIAPKLASTVFSQLLEGEVDDSAFELTIARISVTAMYSKARNRQSNHGEVHLPLPSSLLADKKLQHLLTVTRAFFHAKSGEELLAITSEMTDTSERLYVQRKWLAQNPFAEDALDVAAQTVQDAIRVTEFTPNATFYRELSTPLPHSLNVPLRREIMATIDGQQPVILAKGPKVEYVRLQLQLAHCNVVDNDFHRAASRLEDLYFEIVEPVTELESRITCLAWFCAELRHLDPEGRIRLQLPIDEVVDDDLEQTFASILREGADQFVVLSNALEALSLYLPDTATAMAGRLNTVERQQQAYYHIAASICKSDSILPDRALLIKLLHLIAPGLIRDLALRQVVERISKDIADHRRSTSDIMEVYEDLNISTDPSTMAHCLAHIAGAIREDSEERLFMAKISDALVSEFEKIGAPLDRYRIACQLVAHLKPTCPKLADRVFEYLKGPHGRQPMPENVEHGVFYIFDLLVKAVSALARADLLSFEDVRRVCALIGEFEDLRMQIRLYCTLSFYLWRHGAQEEFLFVVDEHVWPAISGLSADDAALLYAAWITAYPVIWLEDRDRARNSVSQYPMEVRDACSSALIFSLLRGQPSEEPFDDEARNSRSRLTYSDLRNLLQLAQEAENDGLICMMFEWIADEVTDQHAEIRLSREQKADISQRMIDVANTKLPMKSGIEHAGYQILCKCQSLRIQGRKGIDWPQLIGEAEALSNIADRAYVLAYIGSYLPSRDSKERSRILRIVEENIDDLRIEEDQFHRYCRFSALLMKRNRLDAKRVIEKAFSTLLKASDRRAPSKENELIELAYKFDADLPMNLGMFYDDDPARDKYRLRVEKELEKYQLRKDLGDYRSKVDLREIRNDANLANAAWRAIATLNSGRMIATDMTRVRQMVMAASKFPMKTSYPMYSWALSNVMIKYSKTPEATEYVRNMFEGTLRSARFVLDVSNPDVEATEGPVWQDFSGLANQELVETGQREKALAYLRKWFEESADEHVTIVDPYFGPSDLHLLIDLVEVNPWLKVRIITGKDREAGKEGGLGDVYGQVWRELCDHSPPETDILVVKSVESGAVPFHDRWILSKSAGVHLGTSINSLGNRDSVITHLGGNELARTRRLVDKYIGKKVREFEGERVTYQMFELVI